MIINNYTSIVEKDGKRYLFDENAFNQRSAAIAIIDNIFDLVRGWLERNEYPTTPEYITGVVFDRDFILTKTIEETENASKRLKLPRHIAKIHRAAAVQAVSELDTTELDELRERLIRTRNQNNINVTPQTVYFDGGMVHVERDAVEAELKNSCLRPIPDTLQQFADYVRDIMPKLREFDDLGAPVKGTFLQLLGNFLAPHKRPSLDDETKILSFVVTHTHPTRSYMRTFQPDEFHLRGGDETDSEKELLHRSDS